MKKQNRDDIYLIALRDTSQIEGCVRQELHEPVVSRVAPGVIGGGPVSRQEGHGQLSSIRIPKRNIQQDTFYLLVSSGHMTFTIIIIAWQTKVTVNKLNQYNFKIEVCVKHSKKIAW